ncbi:MAG: hypothetical protein K1060chlam5_00028 [Candidatus Anoxychlamydiales bacterium]|nr:hypothetical protein [Candidatus Anoxychlamydiales bacterium]
MKKYILIIAFFVLSSCYKDHLYVQHEKMDIADLASYHVNTPDPNLLNPPSGQKLSVSWDFPLSMFRENLTMIVTVRFWDNKQNVFVKKIDRKRGYQIFKFNTIDGKETKILTYKVEVINEDKELVEEWKHQFYKPLIDINEHKDIKEIDLDVSVIR